MAAARHSRRTRRNTGRFSFLFKVPAIVAIVVAMTVGATVFFQLERVVVAGNVRYSAQEVEQASGLQLGDNLFRLNKYQISSDILEKLPYVESLSIDRHLPSTILIAVKEWDAVAKVEPTPVPPYSAAEEGASVREGTDQSWLISVGGKLLEVAPADSTAISVSGLSALAPRAGTLLAVPQEQQEKLAALLSLLEALEKRGTTQLVSEIDLSAVAHIRLRYDGRFWVKLPMGGDFNYKLSALEEVVSQRESYEKGTMDLTQKDYTVVYSPE